MWIPHYYSLSPSHLHHPLSISITLSLSPTLNPAHPPSKPSLSPSPSLYHPLSLHHPPSITLSLSITLPLVTLSLSITLPLSPSLYHPLPPIRYHLNPVHHYPRSCDINIFYSVWQLPSTDFYVCILNQLSLFLYTMHSHPLIIWSMEFLTLNSGYNSGIVVFMH